MTMNSCTHTNLLPYPFTQGIRLPSGTSNIPSISFSEDNQSGIYLPGPGQVAIVNEHKTQFKVNTDAVTVGEPDNACAFNVFGQTSIHGNITVFSNIVPADDAVQNIGMPNRHFKEAWIDAIGSDLTVQGNLVVNGTQITANAQTVEIKDNIILVNKGQTGAGVSAGYAGIRVDRGDATHYDLVFNETSDKFEVGPVGTTSPIATETYVAANALMRTGGTLTGPLAGTDATFNTLAGKAISSSLEYTSNVAASSAAVRAVYDGIANATNASVSASNIAMSAYNTAVSASNIASTALPKSGGTLTGPLAGTTASFENQLSVQGKTMLNGSVEVQNITTLKQQCRILTSLSVGADSNAEYPIHVHTNVNGVSMFCESDVVIFSDERLKTDIQPIQNALQKINQIKGYTFRKQGHDARACGLLAQELQNVLPEAVHTHTSTGFLTIAYDNVIALLVNAINELSYELEEVKKGM